MNKKIATIYKVENGYIIKHGSGKEVSFECFEENLGDIDHKIKLMNNLSYILFGYVNKHSDKKEVVKIYAGYTDNVDQMFELKAWLDSEYLEMDDKEISKIADILND